MCQLAETPRQQERLLESLENYRLGLAEAPTLHRWGPAQLADGAGDPEDRMTFVISTGEVDRHGDVIAPQGWRLEAYQRNPVFLWAHDYTRPAIGRAVSVWLELPSPGPEREAGSSGAGTWPARPSLRLGHVGGLLARMEFAPTAFAREVALLYRNSYQRGVSVGFKPLAYEERRHEATGKLLGIRFLEQELLEVSAVPVPANRNALRRGPTPEVEGLGATPDELWPELAARVDRLDRTVGELAQLLSPAGATPVSGSRQEEIGAVLEALRGAKW